MPPEPNDLSFNQYSVLIATINGLREEVKANNEQIRRMMEDHEDRIRRGEVLNIVYPFLIVLAAVVVFLLLR